MRDVLVHDQRFELVEHRQVGRVQVPAIDPAGADHLDQGRFAVLHGPDLYRGGVGSQQQAAIQVERVGRRPAPGGSGGRFSAWKLWKSSSTSGPLSTVNPMLAEDLLQFPPGVGDGMQRAGPGQPGRQGDVHGASRDRSADCRAASACAGRRFQGGGDLAASGC